MKNKVHLQCNRPFS